MPDQYVIQPGSVELIVLDVTRDGVATSTFTVAVAPLDEPPTVWAAPEQVASSAGFSYGYLTGQLDPGIWDVYTKIDDNPEHPVDLPARLVVLG